MLFPTLREFYYSYQLPLAHALHNIEQRGLLVDVKRLAELNLDVIHQLDDEVTEIQKLYGRPIAAQQPKNKKLIDKNTCYLSSPDDIKDLLINLGMKVPKDRKGVETTKEEVLQKLFGETGNPILKRILTVRELNKIKGTYLDATLYQDTLYCTYVSIGTVGGRRSSRANFLGLGTNHQNLPKHSALGKRYRHCVIARPGKIFVACDQKGAEDWIVQGIIVDNGGSSRGLDELRLQINRHKKLAAYLFGRPETQCGKNDGEPPGMYYNLGKRTRHAGNYGMRESKMSEVLAKESMAVPPIVCKALLQKFHQYEPDIQGKFQAYVEYTLKTTRTLFTPVGRRRQFLALRPYSDNSTTYREAYSYIPQSTVGDNTGLAIIHCELNSPGLLVADGHDAIYLEVDDNQQSIEAGVTLLGNSFNRTLTFPNGTEIEIPVEYELGYDLGNMFGFDTMSQVSEKYNRAQETNKALDRLVS